MTAIAMHVPAARSMPAVGASRLRLTVRGRRALAVLVAAPVLALGALGVLQSATATAGQQSAPVSYETVVVQPGETLWSIAAVVAPEIDPREVIADIQQLNGVGGAIQPGQQLTIPAEYTR
ncbi:MULTISPECIES: LysM peptidoglycan-binding domain-containing protein [unclassified Agrococcus]|uniref:LysM peptidoglycan-binding domain-containing protein n=1 Tax=unclassified Agrococcus TaxID=2615065 RepID=UPI0036180BC3